jgi:adenine-specific DNA-methyltransferase
LIGERKDINTKRVFIKKEMQTLEYIGCKNQLANWIHDASIEMTGTDTFHFVDACCGTGVVAHHMRQAGANSVHANDTEPYAAVIGHAVARSAATPACLALIDNINKSLNESLNETTTTEVVGLIEREYSGTRMFFTPENARRIDTARRHIAKETGLTEDERAFMIASLVVSADAVSNTTAVYGAFLKSYKKASLKPFRMAPIHNITKVAKKGRGTRHDALDPSLYAEATTMKGPHVVYVDPPYNARQYSKNYFPLNAIAWDPSRDDEFKVNADTVTGIPAECYLSPFCRKAQAAESFKRLVAAVPPTSHLLVSYSSEGIVGKEELESILKERGGKLTVREQPHKRFASASYNDTSKKTTTEYLFCVSPAT